MKGYFITLLAAIITVAPLAAAEKPAAPKFDGEWWTIAGHPYLGDLNTPWQQVVDFGIWQADDGSWQLWSCIRERPRQEKPACFIGGKGHG